MTIEISEPQDSIKISRSSVGLSYEIRVHKLDDEKISDFISRVDSLKQALELRYKNELAKIRE
jgi:hypothetical protein